MGIEYIGVNTGYVILKYSCVKKMMANIVRYTEDTPPTTKGPHMSMVEKTQETAEVS